MNRSRQNRGIVVALWANAALLACVLIALVSRSNGPSLIPSALGQASPVIGGGNGVFVMPAQFTTSTWGCYLLDIDAQTICAYSYFPGERQLRLVAAREYRYDRRLKHFATDNPSPAEVKVWIDKQNQAGGDAPLTPAPSPEQPKDNP